jgi:N-acetylglucosaminyldiphosphoundecaprenol N-acetyl-beta-D-mannosaminyltransferase
MGKQRKESITKEPQKTCTSEVQGLLPILQQYGIESNLETLLLLSEKLKNLFPELNIAGSISPPFRPLTKEEDDVYVKKINDSGADILFVSLGAPKQEYWMYEHKERIKPIQLGVGAAFSFITCKVKQAPYWMQKSGLEWLYRLPQEPKKTIIRMSLVPEFLFRTFIQFLKNNKRN